MRDFNHSVNVLVKAYFEGTLRHGDCSACAVGNLINAVRPFTEDEIDEMNTGQDGWPLVFCTFVDLGTLLNPRQSVNPHKYNGLAKEQIDSTGYSWQELSFIEHSFEKHRGNGNSIDERMFNGLMAVVDVLAEIHGIDLTAREESKKLFIKA